MSRGTSVDESLSPSQFHHRDPGIVGLLTSQSVGGAPVYYSLIADGNHTHETVQRIAYKANRRGELVCCQVISSCHSASAH